MYCAPLSIATDPAWLKACSGEHKGMTGAIVVGVTLLTGMVVVVVDVGVDVGTGMVVVVVDEVVGFTTGIVVVVVEPTP